MSSLFRPVFQEILFLEKAKIPNVPCLDLEHCRVFCFAVFLILLFPILLFGQALNFSLVAEPKCFPALLGGEGLEGQGPPNCLHTHLSAADMG